jgi:DMSO/TMAO reductase YedYZ molybdopterin-dependent catalytic subunit
MRHPRRGTVLRGAYGLDHGELRWSQRKGNVKDGPRTWLGDGGVLLAYAVNGEPLTPEHGFLLRLVVPGYDGTSPVRWLRRLELADVRAAVRSRPRFTTIPTPPPAALARYGRRRPSP